MMVCKTVAVPERERESYLFPTDPGISCSPAVYMQHCCCSGRWKKFLIVSCWFCSVFCLFLVQNYVVRTPLSTLYKFYSTVDKWGLVVFFVINSLSLPTLQFVRGHTLSSVSPGDILFMGATETAHLNIKTVVVCYLIFQWTEKSSRGNNAQPAAFRVYMCR